jgi:hypothetical protein
MVGNLSMDKMVDNLSMLADSISDVMMLLKVVVLLLKVVGGSCFCHHESYCSAIMRHTKTMDNLQHSVPSPSSYHSLAF